MRTRARAHARTRALSISHELSRSQWHVAPFSSGIILQKGDLLARVFECALRRLEPHGERLAALAVRGRVGGGGVRGRVRRGKSRGVLRGERRATRRGLVPVQRALGLE